MLRALYVAGGVLLIGLAFQLFLRYRYIHTAGLAVMRIDRVSGSSCYMPCTPGPVASASPEPTPYDFEAAVSGANEEAIALVKALPNIYEFTARAERNSKWSAKPSNPLFDPDPNPYLPSNLSSSPPSHTIDQVRLVSFVDRKGSGYFWEVHLDTRRVYFVNDDAALSAKYLGIEKPAPQNPSGAAPFVGKLPAGFHLVTTPAATGLH